MTFYTYLAYFKQTQTFSMCSASLSIVCAIYTLTCKSLQTRKEAQFYALSIMYYIGPVS